MDYTRKTRVISNSYYNMGLEKARIRDLTGASRCLKRSLHFNKYQTEARNLLGLIYYEMGEVGDALVQWVISMNLQPEGNRADYYLEELQRKKGSLETERHAIRRFNQALIYAQNGSEDLAVIQLAKVVEAKPGYIKAQLLLAVLYLGKGELQRSGKAVSKVLQIDKNNEKALLYKAIIREQGGQAPKADKVRVDKDRDRKKLRNVLSHRQMEDDDVILPPSYRENTKDQAVLYILMGLALGAAVIFFLVMPARTKAINVAHNNEMLTYSEQLSQANQKVTSLEEQMVSIEAEKQSAEESLNSLTSNSDSVLAQYQNVIGILQAYKKEDFETAVKLYAGLNMSLITSPDVLAVLAEIKTDMDENGYQVLETLGDQASAAGDSAAALDYFLKSLAINDKNWQAKYKVAVIYKGMNEKEQANQLFSDIIANSKDEELSARAKTERGF